MEKDSNSRRPLGGYALMLGLCALGSMVTDHAVAGCGMYNAPSAEPTSWRMAAAAATMHASGNNDDKDRDRRFDGIVGMWKFTLVSDGTAYPAAIPNGAVIDFGTALWHIDKTEITISGGRPPSSGDVCMGVWQQTGAMTYKLKHIALAYVSSDTPPPIGPVSPAAFVGPAILRETVTLNRALNGFEGTFTIDQYAVDETTLLQHIGGKVVATRVTAD